MQRECAASRKIVAANSAGAPVGQKICAATDTEQDLLHQDALKALKHFGQHRDLKIVTRFVGTIAEEKSKKAIIKWFTTHGPISSTVDGKLKFEKKKPVKLGDAAASPYWKYFPKAPKEQLDPIAALDKALRLIKRSKARSSLSPSAHHALISDLEALIRRHAEQ